MVAAASLDHSQSLVVTLMAFAVNGARLESPSDLLAPARKTHVQRFLVDIVLDNSLYAQIEDEIEKKLKNRLHTDVRAVVLGNKQ